MTTCAQVAARTLYQLGVREMFGLPGGEILDFIDAARAEGIDFILVRDEATAAFMADVQGQVRRRPGVCVSTLGPGAMNMALGVANAFLDRSPLLAITAASATNAAPYATHQNLALERIYAPFTKASITLDGKETARKIREVYAASIRPRMGAVHIAIPRDVGATREQESGPDLPDLEIEAPPRASQAGLDELRELVRAARRPVAVIGLDLHPLEDRESVLRFVEHLGLPVFATPKAKGIVPEDHPLFCGICGGVAGDRLILDFFATSDLLLGLGFEPVESDKLWHRQLRLANVGPVSIASGDYRPFMECVGPVANILDRLLVGGDASNDWRPEELQQLRHRLAHRLRPTERSGGGISPYELTVRLRELLPKETLHATDVGSIKFVTTQAWKTFEPLTFFESNGLSSMGYAFPAAMALRRIHPDRPILCTIGDGGFGMRVAELETCVREKLPFLTVVYNDSSLSLIRIAQESRSYPNHGVDFGDVDFAQVARGFGAWSARVESLEEVDAAVEEGVGSGRPAVIDAVLDPREYRAHAAG